MSNCKSITITSHVSVIYVKPMERLQQVRTRRFSLFILSRKHEICISAKLLCESGYPWSDWVALRMLYYIMPLTLEDQRLQRCIQIKDSESCSLPMMKPTMPFLVSTRVQMTLGIKKPRRYPGSGTRMRWVAGDILIGHYQGPSSIV